jgi:nicotinamide mononucleotide transporter
MEFLFKWVAGNDVELLGAVLGIAYIFFSIRQSILTWPVGLLTSALYVWVFLVSKLYADMSLQLYYVFISIYGWYEWLHGSGTDPKDGLKISRLTLRLTTVLLAASAFLFLLIWYILTNFTDSPVPLADALATSLSIVTTWMLARKILEQWLVWIFVDAFSVGLFWYKGLMPTVILFVVYTIMAVTGFVKWRKVYATERTTLTSAPNISDHET